MKAFRDNRIFFALLAALLILIVNAAISSRNTDQMVDAENLVAHAWQVKNQLQMILSTMDDAETGQRGFLVANQKKFLEPYNDALKRIDAEMDQLRTLVRNTPNQNNRMPLLRTQIAARLSLLEINIHQRQSGDITAIDTAVFDQSKTQMDAVRRTIADMGAEEDHLLSARQIQAAVSIQRTRLAFAFATFLAVLSIGGVYVLLQRLIEERVKSETELRAANDVLEQRVVDRTVQLEESNRELEAFSYSVSHDLRAPLRHISGFVELLQKKEAERLSDSGQRYVTTIAESARHAGNLVDDLLAFSRMSRAEMRHKPVQMEQLIAEVRRELELATDEREIEWQIDPLPPVQGDPAMLRLVWQNLISNAIKYSKPRPHTVIKIRSHSTPEEHSFSIQDNGVGFDMRYVDKLFGVFQRLHGKEHFEGTGIGLANVKRIIQRHGGTVRAEGEVGDGATFTFTLPVTPIAEERG